MVSTPSRSPLHDWLASHGARFVARGDWQEVDYSSGLDREYRAAREVVIVADRSRRGRVQVTGKDRTTFLHNMLSNDIRSLRPGDGLLAAFLSRMGKLISDVVVYCLDDSVLLEAERERVIPLTETLARYIVSEDVQLRDVSAEEVLVSFEGPRAAELLARLLDQVMPQMRPYQFIRSKAAETPLRISSFSHGPGPGFDVAIPVSRAPGIMDRALAAGGPWGLEIAGFRTQEVRRIEAGIPRFGTDMDESHLLLETGLDRAVSFSKGCYVGQEYVSRQAHRGHLNRKLVGLAVDGESVPQAGDDVLGEERYAGSVTSAAWSPTLRHGIALAYVHRDFFEPGTRLVVKAARGELTAQVTELPFVG